MRLRFVFWLDFSLLIMAATLEQVPFTGLLLHEWLGVVMIGLILLHILLSWTWVGAASRRLAAPRAHRNRINFLLNFALFAVGVTVLLSGLVVIEVVLPANGMHSLAGDERWRRIHDRTSDYFVIFAVLHLAINWDWTVAAARKCFGWRRA